MIRRGHNQDFWVGKYILVTGQSDSFQVYLFHENQLTYTLMIYELFLILMYFTLWLYFVLVNKPIETLEHEGEKIHDKFFFFFKWMKQKRRKGRDSRNQSRRWNIRVIEILKKSTRKLEKIELLKTLQKEKCLDLKEMSSNQEWTQSLV